MCIEAMHSLSESYGSNGAEVMSRDSALYATTSLMKMFTERLTKTHCRTLYTSLLCAGDNGGVTTAGNCFN